MQKKKTRKVCMIYNKEVCLSVTHYWEGYSNE